MCLCENEFVWLAETVHKNVNKYLKINIKSLKLI